MQKLLTSLAGMDPEMMSRCPRHEQSATWKLGLTLAIPFILALLAGSYTLWTLTGSRIIGTVGGIIWAVCVFLIDLAVMPTLTHGANSPPGRVYFNTLPSRLHAWGRGLFEGDAMPTATRRFARLRILMAFVLGAVISHTLVMGIFSQRIFSEIEADRKKELDKEESHWKVQEKSLQERKPTYESPDVTPVDDLVKEERARYDQAREDLSKLRSEIDARATQIDELRTKAAEEELTGKYSGEGPTCGPYCESLNEQRRLIEERRQQFLDRELALEAAIKKAENKLETVRHRQSELRAHTMANSEAAYKTRRDEWEAQHKQAFDQYNKLRDEVAGEVRRDLLYQAESFYRILSQHWAMWVWAATIFVAVFILDLVPLLLKFWRQAGVYDALVAEEERTAIEEMQQGRSLRESADGSWGTVR
jgi:peptidoglycan hydrolase CwlO-like protein